MSSILLWILHMPQISSVLKEKWTNIENRKEGYQLSPSRNGTGTLPFQPPHVHPFFPWFFLYHLQGFTLELKGETMPGWLVFGWCFFPIFPYIIDGWMAMAWCFLYWINLCKLMKGKLELIAFIETTSSKMDSFYVFQFIFTNTKRCKNICLCGDISGKLSYQ